MGAKFSKTNSKGKVHRDDESTSLDEQQGEEAASTLSHTSTLPASFRHKTEVEVGVSQVEEEVVSKTDSLPRNLGSNKLERNASFSKRFRKSCKNWARDKGIIEKKKEEEKVEDATEAVFENGDTSENKDIGSLENQEILLKDITDEDGKEEQGELKEKNFVNDHKVKETEVVEELSEESHCKENEATATQHDGKNVEEDAEEDNEEKAVNTMLEQNVEEDIVEVVDVEPSEEKEAEETNATTLVTENMEQFGESVTKVSEDLIAPSNVELTPVVEEKEITAFSVTPVECLAVDSVSSVGIEPLEEVTSVKLLEIETSGESNIEVDKSSAIRENVVEQTAEDAEFEDKDVTTEIKEAVELEPAGSKAVAEAAENDADSPIISAFTLQSYMENNTISEIDSIEIAEDLNNIAHPNEMNEKTATYIAKKITEEIVEESVEDVEAMRDLIADIVEKATIEAEPLSFGSSTTKSQSDDLISEDGSDRVMEDGISTDEGIEASDDDEQGNDTSPKYSKIESKINKDSQSAEEQL